MKSETGLSLFINNDYDGDIYTAAHVKSCLLFLLFHCSGRLFVCDPLNVHVEYIMGDVVGHFSNAQRGQGLQHQTFALNCVKFILNTYI